jgi:D-glycero-D-manno-heptose 1,7-bisphosphate phosphatase
MTKKAVFLDRDGTLNKEVGFPSRPSQVSIFSGSYEAVKKINGAGLLAIVLTNQSGVGRGLLAEEDVSSIHESMKSRFAEHGARLDAFYYCPHYALSEDSRYRRECDCRKPNPGLALRAAAEWGIDLEASYFIGDKVEDIELGFRIHAAPILVLTGYGRESLGKLRARGLEPALVAEDVLAAADWILEQEAEKAALRR